MQNTVWKRLSKVIAAVLASVMLLTAVPAQALMAAEIEVSGDYAVEQEIKSNESAVDEAVAAVRNARQTLDEADIAYAKKLVNALSPTNKIRLYIALNRIYYLNNYLNNSQIYFDAIKYLQANPDVLQAAGESGAEDIYSFALDHYLNVGIYEGRSSETSFDPIVAILAYPDSFTDIFISSDFDPTDIKTMFTAQTGLDNTLGYKVVWTSPVKDNGLYSSEPLSHTLHISAPAKGTSQETSSSQSSSSSSDSSESSSGDSGKVTPVPETDPDPAPEPTPDPEPARKLRTDFINRQSQEITPYTIDINSDNYSSISNSLSNKYTLMIYMSGTDQERNESYRRASMQIASMLKAGMDNINVILCVGGVENDGTGDKTAYGNKYLNESLTNLSAGIYYLNPSALTSEAAQAELAALALKKVSSLSYDNNIITSESLVYLGGKEYADMGDAALLAGFLDFAYDNFNASDYGLILSGHGGGVNGGIAYSDSYYDETTETTVIGTALTAAELESAIRASEIYKDTSTDGKLGFIMMDGCLMGSSEVAYNLKDLYRYMIASEEETTSYTDYYSLIDDINKKVGSDSADADIDYSIATAVKESFDDSSWHHGDENGMMANMAVYSSEDVETTMSSLNNLAEELADVLDNESGSTTYSSAFRQDIFMAVRKAALSCYRTASSTTDDGDKLGDIISKNNLIDIGQFLYYLELNLNELTDQYKDDAAASSKLSSVADELLEIDKLGFIQASTKIYNYEGAVTEDYGTKEGTVSFNSASAYLSSSTGNWLSVFSGDTSLSGRVNYIYGSSIYIPLGGTVSEYTNSNYYKYYNGSELQGYVDLVMQYLTYYNDKSEDGYGSQVTALKTEVENLKKKGLYSQIVKPADFSTDDGTDSVWTEHYTSSSNIDDTNFLVFEIADSYAGINSAYVPAHTTGIPMLDILETQDSIEVSAVHKEYIKATKTTDSSTSEGYLAVDMICAEAEVSQYSYSLSGNRIIYNVEELKDNLKGYALEGNVWDDSTKSAKTETTGEGEDEQTTVLTNWTFVLKSNLEDNSKAKTKAVKAATAAASGSTVDNDNYVTFLGAYQAEQVSSTSGTSGTDDTSETTTTWTSGDNVYHVFEKDDATGNYIYVGTVSKTEHAGKESIGETVIGSEDSFTLIAGVKAISTYHYILQSTEITDAETESTITENIKKCLESITGVNDGYYEVDEKLNISMATVTDQKVINYVSVTTNENTGYVVSVGDDYSDIAKIDDTKYEDGNNLGAGISTIDGDVYADGAGTVEYDGTETQTVQNGNMNPASEDGTITNDIEQAEGTGEAISELQDAEEIAQEITDVAADQVSDMSAGDEEPSADPIDIDKALPLPSADTTEESGEQLPDVPDLPSSDEGSSNAETGSSGDGDSSDTGNSTDTGSSDSGNSDSGSSDSGSSDGGSGDSGSSEE